MRLAGLLLLLSASKPWVFFLLVFCLGILAAEVTVRAMGRDASPFGLNPMTEGSAATTAIKASMIFVFGAICFVSGYSYRGDQDKQQRHTYTGVLITERHSASKYTVQPERMAPWTADLCEPEDWRQWEKMIRMTYSVRYLGDGKRCMDVEQGGDYEFYTQGGKRIIYPPEEILSDAKY